MPSAFVKYHLGSQGIHPHFWQKSPQGYEIPRYLRRQLQSLRYLSSDARKFRSGAAI